VVAGAADQDQPLATRVVAAMDRLARGQRSHRQAIASRHGLTPLQLDVLSTLATSPPPEPLVGLLAVELGVAQPTVTDSLQALERKGLVTRGRDPIDGRRTRIDLTDAGRALVELVASGDRHLVQEVATLPRNDQETALELLLTLIGRQLDAGVIDVARTCLTCRFHQPVPEGNHHCTLLDMPLPRADLRLNCAEHEARASA
jgi:DNA-binding MarR family transcriptional regulator